MAKKVKPDIVRCRDCMNAYLMQSDLYDPVVSECTVTHERQVASTQFPCSYFKQRYDEEVIHDMIKAK